MPLRDRAASLLTRLAARVANQATDADAPNAAPANGAVYQGASTTRRMAGFRAPTVGANDAVLGSLYTLRDRSRSVVRNDGYARSAIDRLVTNIIGTGISPLSRADDPEFRKALGTLWLRWTDESDADGRLDYYGQQALVVRSYLESGECFVRLRPRLEEDGLSVPLQVQILEADLCPHTYNDATRRIRAGIEFNGIGQRLAYWMHRTRPGDPQDADTTKLIRVPADSVLHIYEPVRPGQIRGLPHLSQAIVKLHDLDKYDDATLLRQQLANLFVAFLTRPGVPLEGEATDPLTGMNVTLDQDGRSVMTLEPGIFQELAPGEKVDFSNPPEVGQGYVDFVRQQMVGLAAAVDVPYEVLTGDMRSVNDRTVRVILHEFRRRIMMRQHQVVAFQLNRPVWTAWLERVFLAGVLPIPAAFAVDPTPWARVKWMPQGWQYINPTQDIQASKDAIRAGLTSRADVISEQGEDIEEVDAQIAADQERADALGLVLDTDARKTSNAGLTQARPPGTRIPGEDDGEPTPAQAARAATERAAVQRREDRLVEALGRVTDAATRPQPVPQVHVDAPVTVGAPVVNVTTPPAPAPRAVVREVKRDEAGLISEITERPEGGA